MASLKKMTLLAFLMGMMVVLASMEFGEAIRYARDEPCFTDCIKKCFAIQDPMSAVRCSNRCNPLCSYIECFFCMNGDDSSAAQMNDKNSGVKHG